MRRARTSQLIKHIATLTALLLSLQVAAADISIERVPDSGLQPHLLAGGDGATHLVYFVLTDQESRRGELRYRQRAGDTWSEPLVVVPSLSLFDPIARPGVAIDEFNNLHVTYFAPRIPTHRYLRFNLETQARSQAIDLASTFNQGLEAAAAVAVNGRQVSVAWHAGDMAREEDRRVYITRSEDLGETFGEEIAMTDATLGACGCCGLATSYSADGTFNLAFRSAIGGTGRHMQLQRNGSANSVDDWQVATCPVSTNSISDDWLAFETEGKIMLQHIPASADAVMVSEMADTRHKHPAVGVAGGTRVVAFGEADGYVAGGALYIVTIDAAGEFARLKPEGVMIPDLSAPAVSALPGGGFLVLY